MPWYKPHWVPFTKFKLAQAVAFLAIKMRRKMQFMSKLAPEKWDVNSWSLLETLDFWRHPLTGICTVCILCSFLRPLSHQDIVIIIWKCLCRLWNKLVDCIRKNTNVTPSIFRDTPEKFFIQVLVLNRRKRKSGFAISHEIYSLQNKVQQYLHWIGPRDQSG